MKHIGCVLVRPCHSSDCSLILNTLVWSRANIVKKIKLFLRGYLTCSFSNHPVERQQFCCRNIFFLHFNKRTNQMQNICAKQAAKNNLNAYSLSSLRHQQNLYSWKKKTRCNTQKKSEKKHRQQDSTRQNHLQPHFFLLMDNKTSQRPDFTICKRIRGREQENRLGFSVQRELSVVWLRCWRYRNTFFEIVEWNACWATAEQKTQQNQQQKRQQQNCWQNLNTLTNANADKYIHRLWSLTNYENDFVLHFVRFIYFAFLLCSLWFLEWYAASLTIVIAMRLI